MNNKLKTAALSFGVAVLLGSVAIAGAQTDSVEKSSESHQSETINAPAPGVVMVQPAPVVVAPAPMVVAQPMNTNHEHSSSHSTSSESSPNGDSTSEKSSSSRSSSNGY